jgi:3',5'-nucleoside bisphosphate phosphatase
MNDFFKADLHCHSTCSDGTLTPEELVQLAVDLGLSGLSITDHDTVESYKTILDIAKEKNIRMITGVEFSAAQQDTNVHILGYSFSPDNPIILNYCQRHEERRRMRNQEILDLLTKHQMPIDEHEMLRPIPGGSPKSIGRPHIALQMIKQGYVRDMQEAFNKYLGDGKPCYSPGVRFSVDETLDIIHQAGGAAILAHPHLINKRRIVNQLMDLEFDGLEGYYAKFPKNQCEKWISKARDRSWLVTGGSDFHGTIKPHIVLGSSWTPQETFDYLHSIFLSNL